MVREVKLVGSLINLGTKRPKEEEINLKDALLCEYLCKYNRDRGYYPIRYGSEVVRDILDMRYDIEGVVEVIYLGKRKVLNYHHIDKVELDKIKFTY